MVISRYCYKCKITHHMILPFFLAELELGCDNVIEMEAHQTILKHPVNGLDKIDR